MKYRTTQPGLTDTCTAKIGLRAPRIFSCFVAVTCLATACATNQSSLSGSKDWACKMSTQSAQELSLTACQAAVGQGITLCTPPGPPTASTMVCESAASGLKMDALPMDRATMVENGMATQTISAPVVTPDGEIAAVAACAINRRHNSVVYAVLTRGPTTKSQADYLESLGACGS
jgi:hypothetical protein